MINLYKNFLRNIFRVLRILDNADGSIVNHILPGVNNCFESSLVAFFQFFYKDPFIQTLLLFQRYYGKNQSGRLTRRSLFMAGLALPKFLR